MSFPSTATIESISTRLGDHIDTSNRTSLETKESLNKIETGLSAILVLQTSQTETISHQGRAIDEIKAKLNEGDDRIRQLEDSKLTIETTNKNIAAFVKIAWAIISMIGVGGLVTLWEYFLKHYR